MATFADKIISFCKELDFADPLPKGVSVMNPFKADPEVFTVVTNFYKRFYNDEKKRHLILGINPGRFGAGVTGIPFTDSVRLKDKFGLSIPGIKTHETSSVFVYEMIDRYGGPEKFYSDFFISAVSPLGFTVRGKNGKDLNYNYYDNKQFAAAINGFIIQNLRKQLKFGIITDVCFCLGTGKNFNFLSDLNGKYRFFGKVVPLEHPRYVMQYRTKSKNIYIEKYLNEFAVINKSTS